MLRIMLDTDDLHALRNDVQLLATYADLVSDPAALRREYPAQTIVFIDRGQGDPNNEASIIDVETGLYKPSDVPEWLRRKERDGIEYRTVYCNRSTLPEVDAVTSGMSYYRWTATLDGTCFIDGYKALDGPAAVQILDAAHVGVHVDMSIVLEDGWHPTPEGSWLRGARELAKDSLGAMSTLSANLGALAKAVTEKH